MNHIIVFNPVKCGELVFSEPPEEFKYSKWLTERRNKLRKRFYNTKKVINSVIKWGTVCLASLASMIGFVYLIFTTVGQYLDGSAGSMLGFVTGLLGICVGLYTYTVMDDNFPTSEWDMKHEYNR